MLLEKNVIKVVYGTEQYMHSLWIKKETFCYKREVLIREAKEELGLDIKDDEIKYLVGSTSISQKGVIVDKHYNECYLITKEIDITKIKLQKEEVAEVKYVTIEEMEQIKKNNDSNYTFCKWADEDFYREIEILKQKRKSIS